MGALGPNQSLSLSLFQKPGGTARGAGHYTEWQSKDFARGLIRHRAATFPVCGYVCARALLSSVGDEMNSPAFSPLLDRTPPRRQQPAQSHNDDCQPLLHTGQKLFRMRKWTPRWIHPGTTQPQNPWFFRSHHMVQVWSSLTEGTRSLLVVFVV